ncbi:MAG: DUF1573 domain-containing protein [Planctomycetota bacterium]
MPIGNMLRGAVSSLVLISAGSAVALPPPLPVQPGMGARANASNAEAAFSTSLHDFGVVWDHAEVEVAFPFTNTGTEPLVIESMRSTCGCTVPALDKTEYAPGEGGEIKVIFNPHNRKGINNRTVVVNTNDSVGQHRLTIRADVKPVLEIPRPFLRFRTDKGVPAVQTTSIIGRGADFDAQFKAADVQGLVSVTKGEPVLDEREDGEVWRRIDFEVRSLAAAPVGMSQAVLTFTTNDERRSEVPMQAALDVRGDISSSPNRVSLGRLALDTPFENEFIVSSRSATPFEIQKIEAIGTMHDLVAFEWAPVDPKKRDAYRVTFRGTPEAELRQSGKFVVHTDVRDETRIDVAYYGWVPRTVAAPVPPARTIGGQQP